jgi:thiamine-monophosphate kinase
MGGRPGSYLVGLAIPGRTPVTAVEQIYRGMDSLAERHGMALIGGDTSASPNGMMITVMVLGEIERGRAVARSGARVGDPIYVTGTLGDSRAGLEILRGRKAGKPGPVRTDEGYLIRRHLFPEARTAFGRLLGRRRWASAMIDLSDGLATDLRHLCDASRVGARLALDQLPISHALQAYSRRRGRTAADYALRGGEDFELLFTVPKGNSGAVESAAHRMALALTRIGAIVPKRRGITLMKKGGREVPLTARGYEHFRSI